MEDLCRRDAGVQRRGLGLVTRCCACRGVLPLNPAGFGAVAPHSALNVAVSFATNTNWQNYGGETTLSHLTQMLGLTVQNFVSAATGMAVLAALVRGLARRQAKTHRELLGRPDPDLLYILLPLSIVLALVDLPGRGADAPPLATRTGAAGGRGARR